MPGRVLIVSPHFPPVNAPDMQRVRMSLPFFREFGWEPVVLAVGPTETERVDPVLNGTVPDSMPIVRVSALPARLTRLVGVGNLALRALPALHAEGARLIRERQIDLVYFSTTMFLAMPLGRIWKHHLGVPFVLDIQDPWLSDYYETHPDVAPPPKYRLAHRLHAILEPWTMRRVDGLVAVSDAYIDTLRSRYPRIPHDRCATIPFAASESDVQYVRTHPQPNPVFRREPNTLMGVSLGRGGDDLGPGLRIVFEAISQADGSFTTRDVRLHFVGTDYAPDGRARKTVEPVAAAVAPRLSVRESTGRIPYFQALQVMEDADFLVLIGSDDPQYTASKVYPYLLSGKPLVAVVHERSGLVPLLRGTNALVVTFGGQDHARAVNTLAEALPAFLRSLPFALVMDEAAARACSAREMTRAQCALFDRVLAAAA